MAKALFTLKAPFRPAGDQPKAISGLIDGVKKNLPRQTLLGVTGSGKTMTAASVIAQTGFPALVISHNKTLAAQLTEEFRTFFPDAAVEYFVSYYDYYQPEAYIPRTGTYIAKDSAINEEIDRLRHSAMEAILTRKDVIVVASVSCIYGLGSPKEYMDARVGIAVGEEIHRQDFLKKLINLQYERNDIDLERGRYRAKGDVVDVFPSGEEHVLRIEFFGSHVEAITMLDPITGYKVKSLDRGAIFPATFFVTNNEQRKQSLELIRAEAEMQAKKFHDQKKFAEEERIVERTKYDLEMIEHIGYVSGIENYSRYMDGRAPGQPPSTLIDYFNYAYGKENFLTFIDESHMTIPQIGAMEAGDSARKQNLIEYGFRLPSAKDNRPLKFFEFEDRIGKTVFISATPGPYEKNTSNATVEQIVRPTGLVDPEIEIKPTTNQIDDIMNEIKAAVANSATDRRAGGRTIVTTLTKRMAEELATYLTESGMKAAYLHSDIDTMERIDILRSLRSGAYDILVGINLLREGLDLPEVSLVAIMDADKEGYLRSETALIQTMGRAARHVEGRVIMYADRITGSMQRAIDETTRRRNIQLAYNNKHGITPQSIIKKITDSTLSKPVIDMDLPENISKNDAEHAIRRLTDKMQLAAQQMEFEKAAQYRDTIAQLRKKMK
ncbi:MAG: excinuclease ABC subunit B [Candidatus Andersenbacteria bacterium RIFCSPHIGHO2_12_FULL_45_11b]|uniref:UvrABC system protein B n=1 Tax=Candidatus Andersenbacteria bacterium RIFCSPHIGHO2_12_FULL_45_11b TaxID=1797282 RepID=A0A1G1XC13_9BACT|nr:MAG: excinuclease ABC subunit B [Candidatus Andersenbacteria bacterium RIFCSPHIGHO2_12_FULL_45_11b]